MLGWKRVFSHSIWDAHSLGTTTWQSWSAMSTKEWEPKGIACPAKITLEASKRRGQVYWMPECHEDGDWHRRGEYVAAAKVFPSRAGAD